MLLTNKLEPIGTRIFGPVTRELRTNSSCGSSRSRPKCCERKDREAMRTSRRATRCRHRGTRQGPPRCRLRVQPDDRVLVEGINVVKKHQRPNPGAGRGRRQSSRRRCRCTAPNVMLYNPVDKKGDRVGIRTLGGGGSRYAQGPLLQVQRRGGRRLSVEVKDMARLHSNIVSRSCRSSPSVRVQERRCRCRGSPRSRSTWASARRRRTRRSWITPSAT